MSKSFKKNPVYRAGYGKKFKRIAKRHASRKVRITNDLVNGKFYKKLFNRYDITEYIFRYTYKEWIGDNPDTPEDRIRWKRWYYWK